MAIVVEVLNRSGHVISSHKFSGERVVIGRGLNVDLTLQDPHIDARHLIVERAEDTHNLYCEDINSRNGVYQLRARKPGYGISFKHKMRLASRKLFYSGQQFLLGRTVIRIYDADHPVAAPLALSRWEDIGHGLSHWGVWLSTIVAIVLCQGVDAYLDDPTQKNLWRYVLPSGYALLAALGYAGLWAFIGRNLRHEGRFTVHFSIALLGILALTAFDWFLPVLVFNLRLWWAQTMISALFSAVLAFAVGFLALHFAAHLKPAVRAAVAMVVPTALLLSVIIATITRPEFQPTPGYETALVSPKWQVRGSIEREEFLDEAFELFKQAADDTIDDKAEE